MLADRFELASWYRAGGLTTGMYMYFFHLLRALLAFVVLLDIMAIRAILYLASYVVATYRTCGI